MIFSTLYYKRILEPRERRTAFLVSGMGCGEFLIFINNKIRASNLHAESGNSTVLSLDKPGEMNRVMVTAYFVDGTGLVVLDTYV